MCALKQTVLSMVMPSVCRFSAIVMMNDVKQGLLHSYIRHCDQWEMVVPKLSVIKAQLPNNIKALMDEIAASTLHSMKRASAEKLLSDALRVPTPVTKNALCTAQNMIFDFLTQHVAAHSTTQIWQNKRGKLQARVTVTCSCGQKTLVIGTDDTNPRAHASKNEAVRSITTMYFADPPRTPSRK